MADESVVKTVTGYLRELLKLGIPVHCGILFGSHARGDSTDRWSDIDLLVVSSRYDEKCDRDELTLLWRIAARVDSRIEPLPVGIGRWETDDESTIIEIARREGIRVSV